MKRRRTKTSSLIDALTHLDWEHLPIRDALQLFSALQEIQIKGGQVIQALARSLSSAPPQAVSTPTGGAVVMDGRHQERLYPNGSPAKICSTCNTPLFEESPGPWLMNGLCENCFSQQ